MTLSLHYEYSLRTFDLGHAYSSEPSNPTELKL